MDLREQLERAIPHAPETPPAGTRVAAGQVALRRRRTAVAAGAAGAVAAVLVPVTFLAGGGSTAGRDVAPAAPSSTGATGRDSVGPPTERAPKAAPWQRGEPPARVNFSTGTVEVRDGAVVRERRRDLYPGKDTRSVALDLSFRGERYWIALEWDDGGGMSTSSGPDDGSYATFDDFVRASTRQGGMRSGPGSGYRSRLEMEQDEESPTPGTVTGLTVTDERFASDGAATILEQQPSPELPDNFAAPGQPSAAAYVEQNGTRYLVLWRDTGGPPQFITVESAGHGDSLAELLDYARGRYEAEVGLL